MMRGRVATALCALVLALAACAPVATHARTVPATGTGVARTRPHHGHDKPADVPAQENLHAGRALQARSARARLISTPYVPTEPKLQLTMLPLQMKVSRETQIRYQWQV